MGTGNAYVGVKRPCREADRSPPFSAEVKNVWNYTSTPPVSLQDMMLVQQRYIFLNEITAFYTGSVVSSGETCIGIIWEWGGGGAGAECQTNIFST
jgi:hypothetical protein